jgi:hypothetical protein
MNRIYALGKVRVRKKLKEVRRLKSRVNEYASVRTVRLTENNRDFENSSWTKGVAGDGRTVDYRVPLCRMPIRYRVPGLLRVKRARGNQRAKNEGTVENRKVGH